MNDGAWININTGKFEWISEHACWIKQKANADKIGLPESVFEKIQPLNSFKDRKEILLAVMNAGFLRMRGHGSMWAFEFTYPTMDALWACYQFIMDYAGDYTTCRFSNLRTNEQIEMRSGELKQKMQDDPETVMRYASKTEKNPLLKQARPSDAVLTKRYQATPEEIEQAQAVDNGDYLEWVLKSWKKGLVRLPEDTDKLKEQLAQFTKLKRSPAFKEEHSGDINSYTPAELYEAVQQDELLSNKEQVRQLIEKGAPGAKLIGESQGIKCFYVTDPALLMILASGTNWCVTQESYAEEYMKDGPFWAFYKEGEPYALLHPASKQFMDPKDHPIWKGVDNHYNAYEGVETASVYFLASASPYQVCLDMFYQSSEGETWLDNHDFSETVDESGGDDGIDRLYEGRDILGILNYLTFQGDTLGHPPTEEDLKPLMELLADYPTDVLPDLLNCSRHFADAETPYNLAIKVIQDHADQIVTAFQELSSSSPAWKAPLYDFIYNGDMWPGNSSWTEDHVKAIGAVYPPEVILEQAVNRHRWGTYVEDLHPVPTLLLQGAAQIDPKKTAEALLRFLPQSTWVMWEKFSEGLTNRQAFIKAVMDLGGYPSALPQHRSSAPSQMENVCRVLTELLDQQIMGDIRLDQPTSQITTGSVWEVTPEDWATRGIRVSQPVYIRVTLSHTQSPLGLQRVDLRRTPSGLQATLTLSGTLNKAEVLTQFTSRSPYYSSTTNLLQRLAQALEVPAEGTKEATVELGEFPEGLHPWLEELEVDWNKFTMLFPPNHPGLTLQRFLKQSEVWKRACLELNSQNREFLLHKLEQVRPAGKAAKVAHSFSAQDIPSNFWVVINLGLFNLSYHPQIFQHALEGLQKGELEGIKGISGSRIILQDFAYRGAILRMPGWATIEQNQLSRTLYGNPNYLCSNNMASMYRLFDKPADKLHGQWGLMQNVGDYLLLGLGEINNRAYNDLKYMGVASQLGQLYSHDPVVINSVKDLSRWLYAACSKLWSDGYTSKELPFTETDISEATVKGLTLLGTTYASEAEWVVKDKTLKIPQGSTLIIGINPEDTKALERWERMSPEEQEQEKQKEDLGLRAKAMEEAKLRQEAIEQLQRLPIKVSLVDVHQLEKQLMDLKIQRLTRKTSSVKIARPSDATLTKRYRNAP